MQLANVRSNHANVLRRQCALDAANVSRHVAIIQTGTINQLIIYYAIINQSIDQSIMFIELNADKYIKKV